jgi:hypothetical protein
MLAAGAALAAEGERATEGAAAEAAAAEAAGAALGVVAAPEHAATATIAMRVRASTPVGRRVWSIGRDTLLQLAILTRVVSVNRVAVGPSSLLSFHLREDEA